MKKTKNNMSINEALIQGNVGQEPEIKSLNNGKEVANFSIATSEKWTDKSTGEVITKTEWHKIVIFNENLVKLTKNYIRKGSKILIRGKLQTRKWTDQGGVDHYTTEIVLSDFSSVIKLLDSKQDGNQQGYDNGQQSNNNGQQNYAQNSQPAQVTQKKINF